MKSIQCSPPRGQKVHMHDYKTTAGDAKRLELLTALNRMKQHWFTKTLDCFEALRTLSLVKPAGQSCTCKKNMA